MLDRERRDRILEMLRRDTYASVKALAQATGASETTIRRDLSTMETEGAVIRLRGGAELAASHRGSLTLPTELPFEERRGLRPEEKRRIGRHAASLADDGDTIFIDGGSTTFWMIEALKCRSLTIVTNSFVLAEALVGRSSNTIILAGGVVHPDSRLILDPVGGNPFSDYHAAKLFMGVGGITTTAILNNDARLIRVERSMIEGSDRHIVLADSSKFGRTASIRLCGLEEIDLIISDAAPPEPLATALLSASVAVDTV